MNEFHDGNKKDYAVRSVIAALLFEMISGLIALFFALGARDDFEDGNCQRGEKRAVKAKLFSNFSFLAGIGKILVIALIIILI